MKLLIENWRKYLTEEKELEEGVFSKLALAGGLLGGGAPAEMPPDPEPTQQVEDSYAGKVGFSDEDPKFYTYGVELDDDRSEIFKQMAVDDALQGLMSELNLDEISEYRELRTGASDGVVVVGIFK